MKKLLGVVAGAFSSLMLVWWLIWRDWIETMSAQDIIPGGDDLVDARAAAMARHPSSQPRVAPPRDNYDDPFPYLADLESWLTHE